MTRGDKLYSVGPCQFLFLRQARNSEEVRQYATQMHDDLRNLNRREAMPATVQPAAGIAPFYSARRRPKTSCVLPMVPARMHVSGKSPRPRTHAPSMLAISGDLRW